jgi:phospholipase C
MRLSFFASNWLALVGLSMIIVAGDSSAQQTRRPQVASTETTVTGVQNTTSLKSINHIIFMLQENNSFDHYFGALRTYWAANGYPEQSFDGLPQFNSPPGPAPKNRSCDPAVTAWCKIDSQSPTIASFHYVTQCVETPTPFWNESHRDLNMAQPTSGVAKLDGFVYTAAQWARERKFYDTKGMRAMGYYDGSDLNYYYFMASSFATSDRWFAPVMARTPPNRMYLLAGTSHGHAYPLNYSGSSQLSVTTIFQLLENNGISWKIYVHPGPNGKTDAASLMSISYMNQFIFGNVIVQKYPRNIVPASQYFTDVSNGTLPQVALIEPPSDAGLDEHPSDTDTKYPPNIQMGAQYVASIINALMKSSSWTSSAFILTYDEFGGFYDHVPPHPTVSPDGIPPSDLKSGDICYNTPSRPTCDFTYTGYRVPLIVISPFTKKHYVSHTPADYTAILKLIETRFGLPSLSKRDAAQMDMTEFFDFVNVPWWTPPTPPPQLTDGPCYLNQLP